MMVKEREIKGEALAQIGELSVLVAGTEQEAQ
jgi:hypothetical protein